MKIRGIYAIDQKDRILTESELKEKAQGEIVRKLTESFLINFGDQMIKEDASIKYPYGRFYLDIDVKSAQ